jgi:hypothetical protein
MLGMMGRPTTVDLDLYFLAHELHMTVSQVRAMPHREYVTWQAYFKARHALANMKPAEGI